VRAPARRLPQPALGPRHRSPPPTSSPPAPSAGAPARVAVHRFRPGRRPVARDARGGGVLLDLGTHLVDQAVHLLGPVREVWADVRELRDGSRWTTTACSRSPTSPGRLAAVVLGGGSLDGAATGAAGKPSPGWVKHDLDGRRRSRRDGGCRRRARRDAVDTDRRPPRGPPRRGLADSTEAFAGAVRTRVGPPPVRPGDAVHVLRVLEAARRSSDERAVERVRPS
jgi:predicted dehydrogenase